MSFPRVSRIALALGTLVATAFFASSFAGAQTAGSAPSAAGASGQAPQGISFPIPDLGNCGSKDACKAYCDDASHMDACIAFAKSHGLMNQEEAATAQKFAQSISSGGGPGGCTDPSSCNAYCSDTSHLDACVSFAKAHNLASPKLAQGEKILAYLKSGGHTPGGCTSEESCREYCGDLSHAEECFTFAQKAGIAQEAGGPGNGSGGFGNGGPGGGIPSADQLQKLTELVQEGKTPGGCTTRDACQSYCENSAHFNECLSFGEAVGFISPDQAKMMQATGGKGPGGCDSQDSCTAYCNDPSHQQECFSFAQNHGFMSQDQVNQMKQGVTQMRAGLEQAPPQVAACMSTALGSSTIDSIESGQFMPGPQVADAVRNCFQKFGQREGFGNMVDRLPPQAVSCVKQKIGASFSQIESGQTAPTPEMADAVRVCADQLRLEAPNNGGPLGAPDPGMLRNMLQSAPPDVTSCLKGKLGGAFGAIVSGQASSTAAVNPDEIKSCFEEFRPHNESEGDQGAHGMLAPGEGPAVAGCAQQVLGANGAPPAPGSDAAEKIRECMQSLGGNASGTFPGGFPPPGGEQGDHNGFMMNGSGTPEGGDFSGRGIPRRFMGNPPQGMMQGGESSQGQEGENNNQGSPEGFGAPRMPLNGIGSSSFPQFQGGFPGGFPSSSFPMQQLQPVNMMQGSSSFSGPVPPTGGFQGGMMNPPPGGNLPPQQPQQQMQPQQSFTGSAPNGQLPPPSGGTLPPPGGVPPPSGAAPR